MSTQRALMESMQALEAKLGVTSGPSPGSEQQEQVQYQSQHQEPVQAGQAQQVQQNQGDAPILPSFLNPNYTGQEAQPVQQVKEQVPAKPLDVYADDYFADLYTDPATKALPSTIPYERFQPLNEQFQRLKGYKEVVDEIEQEYGGLEGLREARQQQAEAQRQAYERQQTQTHEKTAKDTVQQLVDSGEVSETITDSLTQILARALRAETMDNERQTQHQAQQMQAAEAKLIEKYKYAEPLAIRAALREVGQAGAEQVARLSHNRVQAYVTQSAPPPAAVQQMQGVPTPQGRGSAMVPTQTLNLPNPGTKDGYQAWKEMEANIDANFRQQQAQKFRNNRVY